MARFGDFVVKIRSEAIGHLETLDDFVESVAEDQPWRTDEVKEARDALQGLVDALVVVKAD